MATHATPDTLNTTELILLRLDELVTILHSLDNEFSWERASFIITVVLGFIATVLAGLNIGQALLAAGPGRLKSGHYAIGPWSITRQRNFIREEWRYRTTVDTPIIRFPSYSKRWGAIDKHLLGREQSAPNGRSPQNDKNGDRPETVHVEITEPESSLSSCLTLADRCKQQLRALFLKWLHVLQTRRAIRVTETLSEYFPATWLKLLTILDVERVELWDTDRIGTDFLPADLPAAPAYGSIRDISLLALMAGEGDARISKDNVSGTPCIQSPRLSLTFRNHPLLGVAACLDTFAIKHKASFNTATTTSITRWEMLSETLGLAYGWLTLHGNGGIFSIAGAPSSADQARDLVNDLGFRKGAATEFRQNCFPASKADIGTPETEGTFRESTIEANDPKTPLSNDFEATLLTYYPAMATNWVEAFTLIMARNPMAPPIAFPSTKAKIHETLGFLAMQSHLWSLGCEGCIQAYCNQHWSQMARTTLKHLERGRESRFNFTTRIKPIHPLLCGNFASNILRRAREKSAKSLPIPEYFATGHGIHTDASGIRKEAGGRMGIYQSIEEIDMWARSSPTLQNEWFEAACILCNVAGMTKGVARLRDMNALHAEQAKKPGEPYCGGLNTDAYIMEWGKLKQRHTFIVCLKPWHLYREKTFEVLDALNESWDVDASLPTPNNVSHCDLADFVIFRAILMAALLMTAEDSTILLQDAYERVVPMF